MTVAIYDTSSGALVSIASAPPAELRAGLAAVAFESLPARAVWDPGSRTFVEGPAAVRTKLTRLEMRRRFSLAENVALKIAKATTGDPQVRATLEALEEYTALADFIDLTDEDTIAGVQYAVAVLVAAGLIAEADAAARTAAILAPAEVP